MIRRITLICLVVMAAVALSQFSSSEFHATTLEVKEPVTARIGPDERAVLAFLRSRHTGLSRFEEVNVARAVVREARRNDLDPDLVLAVIQVESGGYNLAASHVGALGLMQLLPSTAEELARHLGLDWRGPDSLFDPVLNVTLGTAYIKQLENRYGDVSTALAAYNWGPGRIDRRIRTGSGVPSIYRDRVMKALDVSQIRRANLPTSG
jgi:soluble lytic murein transglycosylase-like protein